MLLAVCCDAFYLSFAYANEIIVMLIVVEFCINRIIHVIRKRYLANVLSHELYINMIWVSAMRLCQTEFKTLDGANFVMIPKSIMDFMQVQWVCRNVAFVGHTCHFVFVDTA